MKNNDFEEADQVKKTDELRGKTLPYMFCFMNFFHYKKNYRNFNLFLNKWFNTQETIIKKSFFSVEAWYNKSVFKRYKKKGERMRFFIKLFSLLWMCFYIFPASSQEPFVLMVYGDSLAAGYRLPKEDSFYNRLEEALKQEFPNIKVLNASKSGETTAGGVRRQSQALKKKPSAVLLELGINDALRHRPIEETQKNLETMIETFQQNHIPVLLIGMQAPPTAPISYRNAFQQMYRDLAQKYDLILYPFFMDGLFELTPITLNMQSEYFLSDHVHPSAKGVRVMVEKMMPTVRDFLQTKRD